MSRDGGPRWHSNYLVGKLRLAQRLVEACLFLLASRISVARCAHTPFFSVPISFLFLSTLSCCRTSPWAPSAALFRRNLPPQTTPSPTPPPCHPPPGRGLLSLVPSYTACALLFAEPVRKGRALSRGRGLLASGRAQIQRPVPPAPQRHREKTEGLTDPGEQVSDGVLHWLSWVLPVHSYLHSALCTSRLSFPLYTNY